MFNEGSAMQEHPTGYVEDKSQHDSSNTPNDAPVGVEVSAKFDLGDNASWLLRKFVINTRADGSGYFVPRTDLQLQYKQEGEACLASVRARFLTDEDRGKMADKSIASKSLDFEVELENAGEGREWLARKRVIWPLTDELGQHLYNAIAGRHELREYAVALVKGRDDNIKNTDDAKATEQYEKKAFWPRLAMEEAGQLDAVIIGVDTTTEYKLDRMIAAGYRAEANRATRDYLTGVTARTTGSAAPTELQKAADSSFDEI